MLGFLILLVGWLYDVIRRRGASFLLSVLAAGPIPRHIAFVMDGNRRYARRKDLEVGVGHSDGFLALRRVLEVCMRLDVRCVTVYAFSIENFKRSPSEVDTLMNLAKTKLTELCEHGDLLEQYGIRLNVLGKVSLFPEDVQAVVRRAEELTKHNSRAILNLCMPYTSRDEMASAMQAAVSETLAAGDPIESITEASIAAHLMTSRPGSPSPPLDVLVRTSGVRRLSDFLLWQCCEDTQIHFVDTYWPDFGLREFVPIVLDFQRKVWARTARGRVRSQ
ncbi:dehydrodolichyl diphosphate synthetase [Schizopora paradoxa]|uniref:Alkyl transferase n=1 Tax=Schizopora paradoxa TaxID=27342 RepID=A0A0H2RZC0_9AGAM|nr:dehydrodolichyl diphosphate synthetase [Schizopora paradoxa]